MRIKIITESDEDASDYTNPLTALTRLRGQKKDNIDGCTDENGQRREIGEEWRFEDGCNTGMLVSN